MPAPKITIEVDDYELGLLVVALEVLETNAGAAARTIADIPQMAAEWHGVARAAVDMRRRFHNAALASGIYDDIKGKPHDR